VPQKTITIVNRYIKPV